MTNPTTLTDALELLSAPDRAKVLAALEAKPELRAMLPTDNLVAGLTALVQSIDRHQRSGAKVLDVVAAASDLKVNSAQVNDG